MRIGLSGRIGVGLAAFAAIADGVTWLIRAFDNYPFDFYRLSDAYLPAVFLFGVALLFPSISVAFQARRAANLSKFPLTVTGPLPPELRLDLGQRQSRDGATESASRKHPQTGDEIPPPKLAFVPSPSHRKLFERLGCVFLVLAGLLNVGAQWWMATRTYVPLNVVMSFVRGHNRTAEFPINLRAGYLIHLEIFNYGQPGCRLDGELSRRVHWQLLKSGRQVAEGFGDDWNYGSGQPLGRFEAPQGYYSLDFDFPVDCSAPKYWPPPRLWVKIAQRPVWVSNVADFIFYIFVGLGITLIFWPAIRETEELSLQGETRATYRGMAHAGRTLRPLISLTKPISSLRALSFMWVVVWVILWIIFITITPLTPHGLMVHIPKPGTYARADEPWNEPLVVRIDAQGDLYLNRHPVRIAELGPRLELALNIRADRTVFLDGDPNVEAGKVIEAADIALGAGATKIVLVTLSMEKEKPELALKSPCESKVRHVQNLKLRPRWRNLGFYDFYDYPIVSFVVEESGEVSDVRIERKGNVPELVNPLVKSASKLKYPPVPGCGKHELYLQYSR